MVTCRPPAPVSASRDERTAVDKAVSLLLSFGHSCEGLGVSELARRAEMSKSTAFRLLGMLQRNGVVERIGNGYRLGSRLHELAQQVYTPDTTRSASWPGVSDQLCKCVTPTLSRCGSGRTRSDRHNAVAGGQRWGRAGGQASRADRPSAS